VADERASSSRVARHRRWVFAAGRCDSVPWGTNRGTRSRPERIYDSVDHPRSARRLDLAPLRSEYRATVTVTVLVPLTYLALVVAGVDSGTAGMWALGFAAGVSAIALTRLARMSSAPTTPDDVNRRSLLRHAAVMLVLVLLIESITAGLVGGYSPVAVTDGPNSRPIQLHDALETMLGLPVAVLTVFGLGVWSSRRLVGPHLMVWLAAIALGSRAIRLLLYWLAVEDARLRKVAVHGWGYTLIRTAMLAVLIFCLLALGNHYGDRRDANNRP
jgi:hypothetical protein